MSTNPAARRLRERLERPELLVVPGVTGALHARLAEQAGMEAVFVTGAGIANTEFGWPDLGLVTMSETVEMAGRIVRSVGVPAIVDADTGYGNHLNVMRTVEELERLGAAAIMLEDQRAPKRCGHFSGKEVVETREMVEKLVAARRARRDPATILVARTDAISTEGLDRALERAAAYVRAGADVIFVEAPRDEAELAAIPSAVDVPTVVNIVEGGATPLLPGDELERLGFRIAFFANVALRVAAAAVLEALRELRTQRTTNGLLDRMLSWEDRQALVGLDAWTALESAIAADAAAIADDG
jgi:2-methylisocitrate lyase-like PEP mutase family enzyme